MKKIIFFLFFSCYGFSQDIEYIKTLDTVYVNFKEGKDQTKFVFSHNYAGFQERRFEIHFLDNKEEEYFVFYFRKYPNSERREKKIESDKKIVKKSFLRKHKKQIITVKFFKKNGIYKSTYEAFRKCKVIYIIDNSETKKGQYNLYEVQKVSSYIMGE